MKNKKGFTLVELLAVIVILAIIIILVVPNVFTAMEKAKKNAFVIEARKVINAGMNQVQTNILAGAETQSCYTFAELHIDSGDKYHGSIAYDSVNNTYKIYMEDGTYYVKGKTFSELSDMSNIGKGSYTKSLAESCRAS